MSERWGALPLGELHPQERCALCGVSGQKLKTTTLAVTLARAQTCVDVVACERRRYNVRRKLI